MKTAACLAETNVKSRGKRGPLSVWADLGIRDECERLLRAGFSYPQIGIRLVRRFKVVVTDSQIYRLKKELGLAKPAPKRTNPPVSPFTKGGNEEPAEEPEPALPIAAEAEESEARADLPVVGIDQGSEEISVITGPMPIQQRMKRAYEHGHRLNLALAELGDSPVSIKIDCQEEQAEPDENPPVSVKPEENIRETPAGTPDATETKNPPVSSFTKGGVNRTRGDLPSFSEAVLSLLSRETITGCQIKGNPQLSKVACLKRQVSSGRKRYVRQRPGHEDMMLNGMYHACRGCPHFLPDEDYEITVQHVKRGREIRPSD
jgi:hypothetical protein